MAGFVDSLRMNNIFPTAGGNPVFGSPTSPEPNLDFLSRFVDRFHGLQSQEADKAKEYDMNMYQLQRRDRLTDIANQMKMEQSAQQNQPMNVVYNPGVNDYQKATLGLKTQDLNEKKREADQSAEIKQQEADTHKQRADTYDSIMGNKDLSDSEKLKKMQDFQREQQGKTQDFQGKQTDKKIGSQEKQTTEKIKGTSDLQDKKGDQAISQIDERGDQTRETNQEKYANELDKAAAAAKNVTNQTKVMMEGANMLRPHVGELATMATDLNKRNLFGPVMSRIRDLAAKVGTTGDPDSVQKSLDEFHGNLLSDPIIAKTNDAAVGKFVAALGLMASGAGRVHGGARGGGSIQMVNYMKSLLSSDSTLNMFIGRLGALDDYLKTYGAGPQSNDRTKMDSAIDDILSGGKK